MTAAMFLVMVMTAGTAISTGTDIDTINIELDENEFAVLQGELVRTLKIGYDPDSRDIVINDVRLPASTAERTDVVPFEVQDYIDVPYVRDRVADGVALEMAARDCREIERKIRVRLCWGCDSRDDSCNVRKCKEVLEDPLF